MQRLRRRLVAGPWGWVARVLLTVRRVRTSTYLCTLQFARRVLQTRHPPRSWGRIVRTGRQLGRVVQTQAPHPPLSDAPPLLCPSSAPTSPLARLPSGDCFKRWGGGEDSRGSFGWEGVGWVVAAWAVYESGVGMGAAAPTTTATMAKNGDDGSDAPRPEPCCTLWRGPLGSAAGGERPPPHTPD